MINTYLQTLSLPWLSLHLLILFVVGLYLLLKFLSTSIQQGKENAKKQIKSMRVMDDLMRDSQTNDSPPRDHMEADVLPRIAKVSGNISCSRYLPPVVYSASMTKSPDTRS